MSAAARSASGGSVAASLRASARSLAATFATLGLGTHPATLGVDFLIV